MKVIQTLSKKKPKNWSLPIFSPRPPPSFFSARVQSIQHQLAQLDSESWSGRAEADRDRDFLQLLREKEALLQEIILVSKQQHSPETLLQLEEERSRLEEEVQRAHSSQSQGANQRLVWMMSEFWVLELHLL